MTTRYYREELTCIIAQYVIHQMVKLKIPTQIEYSRSSIVVVVPGTYAEALTKAKEEAQHALDRDGTPGAYK